MAITVLKNCLGEGVMSHNHPPLYGSLILGGIYLLKRDNYVHNNNWSWNVLSACYLY